MRAIWLAWLGCSSTPAPAPAPQVEAPPPLLAHPPPMRAIPDVGPADPAAFATRDDGLGIFDEVEGTGELAVDGAVAVAEITSWTPDGTLWDSTWERRGPTRWVVGEKGAVIPGWNEGILGMRAGGVRQLRIPPALGFELGIAGRLPEGAECVSRIELLAILVPPTAPGGPGDLRIGDGRELAVGDTARFDWVGWLPDGNRFDTTWLRPAPFTAVFGEGRLRWESALAGMRVGGRREIAIPADQAFGVEGRPPVIPPNADLRFTVDLQGIE